MRDSRSLARPKQKKKSENCILGFPSQDSCPGFISGDRYCRSIIRAAVSQTSTQAEVCLRPHRWNFPSKKLPFRACVLAFELIGTGGAPRTAAEVTTNIVVGVCDGDATVSPLRDKEGR